MAAPRRITRATRLGEVAQRGFDDNQNVFTKVRSARLMADFEMRVVPYYRGLLGRVDGDSPRVFGAALRSIFLLYRTIFAGIIVSFGTCAMWTFHGPQAAYLYGFISGGIFWGAEVFEILVMVYRAYVGIRHGRLGTPSASAVWFSPHSWSVRTFFRMFNVRPIGLETGTHSILVMGNLQHLFDIFFSFVTSTTVLLMSFYAWQCAQDADGDGDAQYQTPPEQICPDTAGGVIQVYFLFFYSSVLVVLGVGWGAVQPAADAAAPQVLSLYAVFMLNVAYLTVLLGSVHSLMSERASKATKLMHRAGKYVMLRLLQEDFSEDTPILDVMESKFEFSKDREWFMRAIRDYELYYADIGDEDLIDVPGSTFGHSDLAEELEEPGAFVYEGPGFGANPSGFSAVASREPRRRRETTALPGEMEMQTLARMRTPQRAPGRRL